MANRIITRRLSVIVAAPLVAAGIVAATVAMCELATVGAQPVSGGQCTGMTMTDGRGGPKPDSMTRAGQISAATGPGASGGSIAANCVPAGHS